MPEPGLWAKPGQIVSRVVQGDDTASCSYFARHHAATARLVGLCRRLRPADNPQAVSGAFAAADWMFSIAPGGGMSASAAASLRFGHADDNSSDDSEPPLRGPARQQQRVRGPALASPQLTFERDHPAVGFTAMEAANAATRPSASAQHAADEDVQVAQPPRRRVSFANRLPSAARKPPISSGADGAEAPDDARGTAEWVAARVIAFGLLHPRARNLMYKILHGTMSYLRKVPVCGTPRARRHRHLGSCENQATEQQRGMLRHRPLCASMQVSELRVVGTAAPLSRRQPPAAARSGAQQPADSRAAAAESPVHTVHTAAGAAALRSPTPRAAEAGARRGSSGAAPRRVGESAGRTRHARVSRDGSPAAQEQQKMGHAPKADTAEDATASALQSRPAAGSLPRSAGMMADGEVQHRDQVGREPADRERGDVVVKTASPGNSIRSASASGDRTREKPLARCTDADAAAAARRSSVSMTQHERTGVAEQQTVVTADLRLTCSILSAPECITGGHAAGGTAAESSDECSQVGS